MEYKASVNLMNKPGNLKGFANVTIGDYTDCKEHHYTETVIKLLAPRWDIQFSNVMIAMTNTRAIIQTKFRIIMLVQ